MEDYSVYNGDGTVLRKAQLRMLDILVEIDKICRRHNLPYWIDTGTLLGAVRHGGFIPWDDDLDICIMRDDRKKFFKYMKGELPEQFYLFDNKKISYMSKSGLIKVMDRNSLVAEGYMDENKLSNGYGLWVDVFCIERGSVKFRRHIHNTHGRFIRRIQGNVNDGWLNRVIAYCLYPFSSLEIACYRLLHRFSKSDRYIYDLETLVAEVLFTKRQKSQIFPLGEIEFEGHKVLCPGDTDSYLKDSYGDYMQIPPAEKRIIHLTNIHFFD